MEINFWKEITLAIWVVIMTTIGIYYSVKINKQYDKISNINK